MSAWRNSLRRASRLLGLLSLSALASADPLPPSPVPEGPGEDLREIRDQVARDFPLRSLGKLQITNLRGGITVQGWGLERIRVRARRRAVAATYDEARRLLATMDFRYTTHGDDIELSAEYGQAQTLQERLRARKTPRTSMEMVVSVPASVTLRILAVDGTVTLRSLASSVEARTSSGGILAEDLRGETNALICPECPITARDVRGSLRVMGGVGQVAISRVRGAQVYLESTAGNQSAVEVEGEQLYVLGSGSLQGVKLRGKIAFHSESGEISIDQGYGFVSGSTDSGAIKINMREWRFADKAVIESGTGDILMTLPAALSAEASLSSQSGQVRTTFTVEKGRAPGVFGPEPANRIRGRIGDGGEELQILSRSGKIELLRGLGG